jgi:outer membrane receptor protein involved in Fe transport
MADEHGRTHGLIQPPSRNLTFALSAAFTVPAGVAVAQDQDDIDDMLLEEVMVTATRQGAQSAMDIPESIQAISEETIRTAGLLGIDDYARFIPSLSYVSANPGTASIYFRGVADAFGSFIAESSSALYLDEQSLTLNSTPNPRMVDIERIEALSGPQGTLYGANAQSGLLRIITNKPDPTAFDSFIDLTYKGGSDVDDGYDISAMANIPLGDSFALRLVGFTAEDGGFIDNVNGDSVPYGVFNNAGQERENFNSVEYKGGRIAGRWLINDDWMATASVIYQDTRSNGRPEQDPTVGRDLAVARFKPDNEFDDQDWSQYALTIEGDLGFADFVSATSYFTRDWVYQQDTQTYAAYFGTFCYDGYYVAYSNYSPYCFQPVGVGNYYNDPIGFLQNEQKDTKFAQEFRLFSQGDRFDWVAGVFYEKAEQDWVFDTFADGYGESKAYDNWLGGRIGPIPTRDPEGAWWRSADSTEWTQYAIFGEVTWHITDKWDATFGGRWFDRQTDKIYFVENPRYNLVTISNVTGELGVLDLPAEDSDFVPKLSVSWRPTDNMLFYALYSEGFRPGGTNRTRTTDTFFPQQYEADFLKNFEIGTKMTLADGRVNLTATYFNMLWDDYQLEVIDPSNAPCGAPNAPPEPFCGQPFQVVVGNVGDATSEGIELQLDALITQNFTGGFNATWLDATLDDGFNFGVPVPAGSRLPLTPEFQGSFFLQYDWDVNWFSGLVDGAYARLQWSYTGDILNQVEPYPEGSPSPQFVQPSYDIGDFKVGTVGEDWSLQLFVNNLTDTRAVLYDNPFELDNFFGKRRQTINRPREYGIRFIKNFR